MTVLSTPICLCTTEVLRVWFKPVFPSLITQLVRPWSVLSMPKPNKPWKGIEKCTYLCCTGSNSADYQQRRKFWNTAANEKCPRIISLKNRYIAICPRREIYWKLFIDMMLQLRSMCYDRTACITIVKYRIKMQRLNILLARANTNLADQKTI